MAKVIVKEGESLNDALFRFKRACGKEGIKDEVMRRKYYTKPSVKKRLKHEHVVKLIKAGRR